MQSNIFENNAFKNFLIEFEPDNPGKDYSSLIREIEDILSDSISIHNRVVFLQGLLNAAIKDNLTMPTIPIQLSQEQFLTLVEKGLVHAYKNKEISAEEVLNTIHSIESIHKFSDVLLSTPYDNRADCWKNTLSAPFATPNVDFARIFNEVKEPVWGRISQIWDELKESVLATSQLEFATSRDLDKEIFQEEFHPENTIDSIEIWKHYLDSLVGLMEDHPKIQRSPAWQQIKSILNIESTWQTFLAQCGLILRENFSTEEIILMQKWISEVKSTDFTVELRLLALLLKSEELIYDSEL